MKRKHITKKQVQDAKDWASTHTDLVLNKKGYGSFASRHEILGVFEDERRELVKAIQKKQSDGSIIQELLDLQQICVFGIASISSGGTDW